MVIKNFVNSDVGTYECTVKIGQEFAVGKVSVSQISDGSGDGSGQLDQELTILDDFVTDIGATVDPDCLEDTCPGSMITVLNFLSNFRWTV